MPVLLQKKLRWVSCSFPAVVTDHCLFGFVLGRTLVSGAGRFLHMLEGDREYLFNRWTLKLGCLSAVAALNTEGLEEVFHFRLGLPVADIWAELIGGNAVLQLFSIQFDFLGSTACHGAEVVLT